MFEPLVNQDAPMPLKIINAKKLKDDYQITKMKTTVINEMADGDLERLHSIIFREDESPLDNRHNEEYFGKNGMVVLGEGHFGVMYEFVGSDGYKYAVKIAKYDPETYPECDAQILEKLQGIKGYAKLFSYSIGEVSSPYYQRSRHFTVMISQKIFGFTVRTANSSDYCREVFYDKAKEQIIEIFSSTIAETLKIGYDFDDARDENIMIDIEEGVAMVVDVGCFRPLSEICKSRFMEPDGLRMRVSSLVNYSRLSDLCKKSNNYNLESPKFSLEVKEYEYL